jgi:hypothetical protein
MKNVNNAERLLNIDHLPKSLKMISQIIGLERTVELSEALGGTSVYICGVYSIERTIRNRRIRDEYDRGGTTVFSLARKFGLGQRTVEKILSEGDCTVGSENLNSVIPLEYMPRQEELPGDLELIAEVIGVESTIALSHEFRGCKLYIAKIDRAMRKSAE